MQNINTKYIYIYIYYITHDIIYIAVSDVEYIPHTSCIPLCTTPSGTLSSSLPTTSSTSSWSPSRSSTSSGLISYSRWIKAVIGLLSYSIKTFQQIWFCKIEIFYITSFFIQIQTSGLFRFVQLTFILKRFFFFFHSLM